MADFAIVNANQVRGQTAEKTTCEEASQNHQGIVGPLDEASSVSTQLPASPSCTSIESDAFAAMRIGELLRLLKRKIATEYDASNRAIDVRRYCEIT